MSDIRPMTELEIKMMCELYQLRAELAEARREQSVLRASIEDALNLLPRDKHEIRYILSSAIDAAMRAEG